MSEFIGSRISLISKSDIKYIGTLHEINSDTSTVALENVTSYGTEGRKGNPAEEIAGSDQIYEYIVFRGSDVKALNIVEAPKENAPPAPVPNDPAILGSARPIPQNQQQQAPPQPHQHNQQFRGPPPQNYPPYGFPPQGPPQHQFQQPPRFQGGSGAHGFPGAPGAVPGYGAPPPGYGGPPPGYGPMGYGPPPGHGFQGPPPGHFSPANQQPIGPPGQHMNQQRPPQPQQQQGQQQAPIGSKQATPQPAASQAPPPPPGLQAPQQQKPVEMSTTPAPPTKPSAAGQGPPPPIESKPSPAEATAPPAGRETQHAAPPKPASRAGNRVAVPLPSPNTAAAKPQPKQTPGAASQAPPAATAPAMAQGTQSYADATQAATAAVAAAMAKLGPTNNQGRNESRTQQMDGALDNLTQKVNQMRVDGQREQRGRGRGRGRGEGRGGRGDATHGAHRGGRRQSATQAIDVPNEDYDFDAANAKFNKQDLVKEAIAGGSPVTSPTKTNGTVANPLENGHATNRGETDAEDVIIPAASEKGSGGYDKKSSFFDNISSDLKDRIEQQQSEQSFDGRAMRNQERSRNVETFGQGSVDNGGYRGGFRGRGRGRGYGRGGRGNGGEGQRGARVMP